jgi:hypothetical protein
VATLARVNETWVQGYEGAVGDVATLIENLLKDISQSRGP